MSKPLTILTPGNMPERKNIDYCNASDKIWMHNHITWCIWNDKRIAIVPLASEESDNGNRQGLVAAAPELLRALKDILDMIGPLSDIPMIRRKNSALNAIRLATEESES